MAEQQNETERPAAINVVSRVTSPQTPTPMEMATVVVTLPPGSPGNPPHRHHGPVFGYLVRGELLFEVEGEAPRVIRPGEAFWEPGGDLIHYQDANNLADAETEFVVMMMLPPGADLLTVVDEAELEGRKDRRVSA